jgi:hypothetical protein
MSAPKLPISEIERLKTLLHEIDRALIHYPDGQQVTENLEKQRLRVIEKIRRL